MSLIEFLSFAFVQRAVLAGVLIAIITSALGVFLVLKRLLLFTSSIESLSTQDLIKLS